MAVIKKLKSEKTLPVVITDQHGNIIYVNSAFEKLFGWSFSEVKDKHLTLIIPERFHDAHNLGFSRFLTTGQATILNKPLTLSAIKKNGEEFKSIHMIFAEQMGDQWQFAATIRLFGEGN